MALNRTPTDMIVDRQSGQKLSEQLAEKATKRKLDLVADFNADHTGVVNASSAIQAAINSIPDGESGATITFPSNSVFKLNTTINIINKHNIRFEPTGSGYMSSTFEGITSGMTMFNIQAHGISFAKTRLKGDSTMTGVVIGDRLNTTYDEFRFEEDSVCLNLGIGIRSKMRNWWVRDSTFIYCNIGIQIDGYTNDVDNGQDYHIINNRFHGCQQYAVYGAGFTKDIMIHGNKIDDSKHGIVLDAGADNAQIAYNVITQSWGNAIKVNQTQQGKLNVDISHNIITGNKTTDDGHGIWFNGNKSSISHNQILQKYGHGIYCENLTYGNVESNFVEGCSYTITGFYGIYIKAGTQMFVDKNTCRNSGRFMTYGIYVEDAVTLAIFGQNIGEGSTDDIYVGASTSRGTIATPSEMPRVIHTDSLPTTGTFRAGDEVRKRTIAEAGTAGSKYVSLGWKRLTTGSGNVLNTDWLEMRTLTGN